MFDRSASPVELVVSQAMMPVPASPGSLQTDHIPEHTFQLNTSKHGTGSLLLII